MAAAALCHGLLSRQPPQHLPGFAHAVSGAARPVGGLPKRGEPVQRQLTDRVLTCMRLLIHSSRMLPVPWTKRRRRV